MDGLAARAEVTGGSRDDGYASPQEEVGYSVLDALEALDEL